MKLPQPNSHKVEINLVPLLDSIFILIFFFMFALTTMVKRQGLPLSLPLASAGDSLKNKSQTLSVTRQGQYFWGERLVSENELYAQMTSFKKSSPNKSLIIQGSQKAELQKVIKILDKAKNLGITKVTLETKGTN